MFVKDVRDMTNPIKIEIVSDHVCPWCYVGKRRLEAALAQRPELDVEVTWQPYQLSPDMPREGRKKLDHYREIFGEERAETIMGSMKDTGIEEGIAFGNDPDAISPNSNNLFYILARQLLGGLHEVATCFRTNRITAQLSRHKIFKITARTWVGD